jgi:hypothetical protein
MPFNFFGNDNRQLRKLINELKQPEMTIETQTERVVDFFAPLVTSTIKRMETPGEGSSLNLIKSTLNELTTILLELSNSDIELFITTYKQIVVQLLELCLWKQQAGRLEVAELARLDSAPRASVQWFVKQLPPDAYTIRMWHLIDTHEHREVEYRTLRAVMAKVAKRSLSEPSPTLFAFVRGQLLIRRERLKKYVSEQVELYVYLFINKQRVKFLEKAVTELGQSLWVELKTLRGRTDDHQELKIAAEEMALKVQGAFVAKYDKHRQPPDYFYLDALMLTYLYGYADKEHLVGKYVAEQIKKVNQHECDGIDDPANTNQPNYYEIDRDNERDRIIEVVRYSLKALEKDNPDCAKIINKRYFGDYESEKGLELKEVATQLGLTAKTVYGRNEDCVPKLRKMIVTQAIKQGLKISRWG